MARVGGALALWPRARPHAPTLLCAPTLLLCAPILSCVPTLSCAPIGFRYAGLLAYMEHLDRDKLIADGKFNQHTVYALAPPLIVPEEHTVTIAVSTENLLLNAYRQSDFGVPKYLCVDTTHRLVKEGHCCMPVGTMSLSQKFHIIGYGVCSHEDVRAHEYVLSAIRDAVERVVSDRRTSGQRI